MKHFLERMAAAEKSDIEAAERLPETSGTECVDEVLANLWGEAADSGGTDTSDEEPAPDRGAAPSTLTPVASRSSAGPLSWLAAAAAVLLMVYAFWGPGFDDQGPGDLMLGGDSDLRLDVRELAEVGRLTWSLPSAEAAAYRLRIREGGEEVVDEDLTTAQWTGAEQAAEWSGVLVIELEAFDSSGEAIAADRWEWTIKR